MCSVCWHWDCISLEVRGTARTELCSLKNLVVSEQLFHADNSLSILASRFWELDVSRACISTGQREKRRSQR